MKRLFPSKVIHLQWERSTTTSDAVIWLVVARIVWLVVTALTLTLFIVCIPLEFARYQPVCTSAGCLYPGITTSNVREMQALNLPIGFISIAFSLLSILFPTTWLAAGVIIFLRTWGKPDGRIALLVALMLVTAGTLIPFDHSFSMLAISSPVWRIIILFVAFVGLSSFLLFFYLFPDGHFVLRWTRIVAMGEVILLFCVFLFPKWAFFQLFLNYSLEWLLAAFILGCGIQLYRYWRVSDTIQKQQTRWIVFGIAIAVVILGVQTVLLTLIGPNHFIVELSLNVLVFLSFFFIPIYFAIAILRYRLWNIDIIINRTLVYGILTACIVAIYILVVGSLGALFQANGNLFISLLATGLVAILFQPLRIRLQRSVNRLMYGDRDEPYTVLSRLRERLEVTIAPEAVLPVIVETIALALKLPYTAITMKQENAFVTAASYGQADKFQDTTSALTQLPLIYQQEQVGNLVLAPRAPGEAFTQADQQLFHDLAQQAGTAIHAIRLTQDLRRMTVDLQQSRERLVLAREEERRRMRRDLHDGLGPSLGALTLKIGSARYLLEHNPTAANKLMAELESDIEKAVIDIRRLVYALRPPALDELGLLGAIREGIAQYTMLAGAPTQEIRLHIGLDLPDQLPALPAAVEVAAYRIIQEALTNVTRHAHAQNCQIHLWLDDGLRLEITDDGIGLQAERHIGVGLSSMNERAQELGGTCTIDTISQGGTRVYAYLPVEKQQA